VERVLAASEVLTVLALGWLALEGSARERRRAHQAEPGGSYGEPVPALDSAGDAVDPRR
jgi:hypothetical protein